MNEVDLSPYKMVEAPISSPDPDLRRKLIGLGGRIGLVMEMLNLMPEDVAQRAQLSTKLIDQVRLGTEVDIGIRAMTAICNAIGCQFRFGISDPPTPVSPTSAPQTPPTV